MLDILKNIIYFKNLIESNNGIYHGWEVLYNDKIIAELNFTDTRCGRQNLYEIKIENKNYSTQEIKEILEFRGLYRNKFFSSKFLKPEVDFICNYYPEFNKLGAEYLLIYENKDLVYNGFYKIIIKFIHFFRSIFPDKRAKKLIVNNNFSKMIPRWIKKK